MAQGVPVPRLIRELAPRYGIDPDAAIAVARGEGGLVNREDDIGDLAGGGSYGPFQLYAQGALPASLRGRREAADAWAWSPAGIEYALRKMKEVGASGLTGAKAVETIIRKFERPADPDTSVKNALARLGASGGAPAVSAAPASTAAPAHAAAVPVSARRDFAQNLLAGMQGGRLDTRTLLSAVLAKRAATTAAPTAGTPAPAPSASGQIPEQGRPGGGLFGLLRDLGLDDAVTSGYRPGAVTVNGTASFHSQKDAHGRPRAYDINPRDPDFPRLVAAVRANPGLVDEFIFDPLGWYVDRGKIHKGRLGGHGDHAHIGRQEEPPR